MLTPGLVQGNLEFARVYAREQIARFHPLAFLKIQLLQLTADPAAHHHCVEGSNSTYGPERVVEYLLLRRCQPHGDSYAAHCSATRAAPHRRWRRCGRTARIAAREIPPGGSSAHTQHNQPDQRAPAASAR